MRDNVQTMADPLDRLANRNPKLSRLGLGLSRQHYLDESAGIALIHSALDLGITHFDTARLYGDGWSERVLGKALSGRRDSATIATKFGLLPSGFIESLGAFGNPFRGVRSVSRRFGLTKGPARRFDVATLDVSLERSLRALATDRIDILFLHDPVADEMCNADALFARLAALKDAGKICAVGIAADGAVVDAVIDRYRDAIDIVQTPEMAWPTKIVPDLTFGALGTGRQVFGQAAPDRAHVHAGLLQALERRPQGCILVGTTKPANLRELAGIANGL